MLETAGMLKVLKKEEWFHEDGFPICVHRREPQEPFGPHTHEFAEIVVILGGTGLHVTGDEGWQLSSGDVFVIGGDRPHDYQQMRDLRLVNILFDMDALAIDAKDLLSLPGYHALFKLSHVWHSKHQFRSRMHLSVKELQSIEVVVDRLENVLAERRAGFQFLARAYFMQIMGLLSVYYEHTIHPKSQDLLKIAKAITYLESMNDLEVTLEDLARASGMSKRTLIRSFQAAFGKSPIAYLIEARVQRATELLRSTEKNVTEVAMEVGFNDSNYFSRQFRKLMHLSPREYRKRVMAET
ncbi:AraC family transcriptional regulator [Lacunimicrobium album]|jgi:AraC-like DNA-binding protein/mannose-6-phosphate isomerase-like protein (cupin superfamily)